MLIYSPVISNRLRYITRFIGDEITGKAFELTSDRDHFIQFNGGKINYSDEQFGDAEVRIAPVGLLFEKGIQPQIIEMFDNAGTNAFFRTTCKIGFDLFAATFYLISRYEEYLPHEKDMYGRYAHTNALAYRGGFLDKPLVNVWLQILRQSMREKFPAIEIPKQDFRFLPTYDIDEAYSHLHKDWWRRAGAVTKNMLKGEWQTIAERRGVLSGSVKDPFDSFDWMDSLHDKYGLQPEYFFLVAKRTGKYDRNILPKKDAVKELIKRHAKKYKIGIHPSWQSGDDASLLAEEISTISKLSGEPVTRSRQHFIRMTVPETFRQLLALGIREDYSMGYGSVNGFRASVASSFNWFDVERDVETELRLVPFCYMDANSFFEQRQTAADSLIEMRSYLERVKEVNGLMVTLWHNTFLGSAPLFKGWREIYEKFVEEATKKDQLRGRSGGEVKR